MPVQRRDLLSSAGVAALVGLSGCTGVFGRSNESESSTAIGDGELVLATTTSTYDTGLLDELNPAFEERYDLTVKTLSKGTGASIRTAQDGDADVILVHARGAEDEFLRQGYGVNRRDVMSNDFVIVGPESDPAGINGTTSATDAFATIADQGATFVSRGDDSGTHKKEQTVWSEAGVDPGGQWYQAIGKGMGDTLVQAGNSGAYTLADRGSFLSMRDEISLVIHVQGPLQDGPVILKNPYGVIPVNPAVHDNVNYQAAMAYTGFLTSPTGQGIIDDFTASGKQLFFPSALSEEPNLSQYAPEGWSESEAESLSSANRQYLYLVDRRVPDDY